jgi:hypothetical protein
VFSCLWVLIAKISIRNDLVPYQSHCLG